MHNESPGSGASNLNDTLKRNIRRFIQGMLIGLGAVLPGISGGAKSDDRIHTDGAQAQRGSGWCKLP